MQALLLFVLAIMPENGMMQAYFGEMHMPNATGRALGGAARAKALSPDQRADIARKGAAARWSPLHKPLPVASYRGTITIGDLEIPCAVLDDDRRVITQLGFLRAIGRGRPTGGSSQGSSEENLPAFLTPENLKPFISNDLREACAPIVFKTRQGGKGGKAFGYQAELLPKVCDVYLQARREGKLLPQQTHVAHASEVLVRGLAEVGIIGLVDEATGFQRDRAKDALARILEAFIAKELQPWVRTFPADYYEQMFRLRGLEYPSDTVQRPKYFGVLTNDVVYKRLAPGVLEELQKVTPRNDSGRPTAKFFQMLTRNLGYPKLREHLGAVVAVMRLSTDWHDFKAKLDRLYPRLDGPTQYAFEYGGDDDDGKGL